MISPNSTSSTNSGARVARGDGEVEGEGKRTDQGKQLEVLLRWCHQHAQDVWERLTAGEVVLLRGFPVENVANLYRVCEALDLQGSQHFVPPVRYVVL